MPKVTVPALVEGDVLDKDQLLKLKTAMAEVDTKVDQENIRQEGLDRRVFKPNLHARNVGLGEPYYNNVYVNQHNLLPRSQRWTRMKCADGLFNSAHPLYPEMWIPWNPETDTHCIIRASFFVNTKSTPKKPFNLNDAWDFGLMIKPPEDTSVDGPSPFPETAKTMFKSVGTFEGGSVWPYQRMCLSYAFTRGARHGFYDWAQAKDHQNDPAFGYNTSDYVGYTLGTRNTSKARFTGPFTFLFPAESVSAYGELDPSPPDFTSESRDTSAWYSRRYSDGEYGHTFLEDRLPRGAWDQYPFSRQSNMNQSFTLISHATSSKENAANGSLQWTTEGRARVSVYYRCNLSRAEPFDNPNIDLDVGVPNLENFRMSYQIIRR